MGNSRGEITVGNYFLELPLGSYELGIAVGNNCWELPIWNYYLNYHWEVVNWELLLGITVGNYYLEIEILSRSYDLGSVFGVLPS